MEIHLQDYLVVRHNMPCTAKFDVRQAVEVWISRARRKPWHDRDIAKFMHQEYVSTFFGTSSCGQILISDNIMCPNNLFTK